MHWKGDELGEVVSMVTILCLNYNIFLQENGQLYVMMGK